MLSSLFVFFLLAISNLAASSYPLQLSFFGPQEEYTALSQLQVGQPGVIIGVTVHNVTYEPTSTNLVVEDISENGFTDSIQFRNVTIDSFNETSFGFPWIIRTAGNHTLEALALTPDNVASVLAEKVTVNGGIVVGAR
jgi:hypothetical protein